YGPDSFSRPGSVSKKSGYKKESAAKKLLDARLRQAEHVLALLMICRSCLPGIRPNATCGWSRSSKRSPELFAARMEPPLCVSSSVLCLSCANRLFYAGRCFLRGLFSDCTRARNLSSYKTSHYFMQTGLPPQPIFACSLQQL